jgi:hypothetical protein
MAFDFGAALSSVGQLAPAMSEGAEIRRQRAADAAAVSQAATASQDTHEARQAQTAREQSLTKLDERNATKLIPLSTKPERGEDGKYYMLFADPATGRPQRLPVDGNYDPSIEKRALLKSLNIPEDSDLGKQVILGIKPTAPQMQLKQDAQGNWSWLEKPGTGMPSSTSPTAAPPASPGVPAGPGVIPTGFKGRVPATDTTSSHVYHWVDNQGQVHETPYTTSTHKGGPSSTPQSVPRGTPPRSPGVSPSVTPKSGLIGKDKIIGTGKLPASAEKIIITTQPVIDQTNALIKRIDDLGLANNNDRFYLAPAYAQYRMGKASDPGSLGNDIAALSLGSVVDATSALQGGSRALPALKLAMQHTPNVMVDSPKLLREKLVTINGRLNDIVNEARSAGNAPQKTGSQSPNAWEQTATGPGGKKAGLRGGKWFDISTGQEIK